MPQTSTLSSNVAVVNVDLVLDLPHNFYHILNTTSFTPILHTKESASSIADTTEISNESRNSLLNSGLLPKQCIVDSLKNIQIHTHNDSGITISLNTDLQYAFPEDMEFNVIAEHLGNLHLPSEYTDTNFKFIDIKLTPGITPEYGLNHNTHPNSAFTFKQTFNESDGMVLVEFTVNEQSVSDAWNRILDANPDNVHIQTKPPTISDLSTYSQLTLTSIEGEAGIILVSLDSSIDRNGDVRNVQDSAGNTNTYFHNMDPESTQFISKDDLQLSADFLQKYHLNTMTVSAPA
jgi:hypothetical protein